MQTKRMMQLVIVLFLLAALPGLTAVVAQEQGPAGKEPLPAALEVGESEAPSANLHETEPNNSNGSADILSLGDVMGAGFSADGDIDFFKFYVEEWGTTILIDTDAQSIGADIDTEVTLYDSNGVEIGFNDDSGDTDSMLYRVVRGGWYFVKVTEYYSTGCDSDCYYNLIVSSPLLISAAAANLGTGRVAGIPFRSEDILAHSDLNDGQEKWVMFFDGSDAGITKPLVNLSAGWVCPQGNCPSLAVSFGANQVLTDLHGVQRTFKPQDWAVLSLDQIGTVTVVGDIEYHRGIDNGLSTSGEKLDALAILDYTNAGGGPVELYFSTVGSAAVPKADGGQLRLFDEDILVSRLFNNVLPWRNSMGFDGSDFIGLAGEDVFAFDLDEEGPPLWYFTILGSGNIDGQTVTQKDIFSLEWSDDGYWGGFNKVWHGPSHGWNYNIDAFDWPGE